MNIGYTVYIQNKLDRFTMANVAASKVAGSGWYDWSHPDENQISQGSSVSHAGFSLWVPNEINQYWLVLGVQGSLEYDKWRGPFGNTQDICWHFHGHLESWEVFPCP